MKPFVFLISFNLYFTLMGQNYSELRVHPRGHLEFQGEKIKLKKLKPIILEKNDPQLSKLFKKARRKEITQRVFGRIRDFGLFYAVVNEPFARVQPIPIGIGLAGLGGNLAFRKSTQKAIHEMVDYYSY